ncbi:DUF5004 domain-containing protein [Croceimicrobium hydrocarbonivorans]|uniref:DUF5004 domain-containing protein n=1 Tax=Croceimicrobium hydrocarbonivorans TaxID=2761580 RepID=A0A7H0VIR8_9FLAO|nr:DUF5004 domain-containing protein [Croceimicrobium hydrocarbonivorans]QNR25616.1 DUF5004 domain-containing protein [Croceimicrobium hydrocarbonivorans]
MKKLLSLGLLALAISACRPEPFKEIGAPYSVITGINGNWDLEMVEVEDRSFPQWETLEFTDFFLDNPVSINFNSNDNTYAISANSLDGLPFSSLNGTYAFDDPEYPENLYLISTDGDTSTVGMGNMVRAIDPNMIFEELKNKCDAEYARYIYTFKRSN